MAAMIADHLNTFAARFVRSTGSGVGVGSSGVVRLAGLPSCARGDWEPKRLNSELVCEGLFSPIFNLQ